MRQPEATRRGHISALAEVPAASIDHQMNEADRPPPSDRSHGVVPSFQAFAEAQILWNRDKLCPRALPAPKPQN